MTSLYSHDILVLFQWIIKQDYKTKYLATEDWNSLIVSLPKKQRKKNTYNDVQRGINALMQRRII